MSKYIFLTVFLLSFIPKGISQSNLSDFSFVIVPEQFEFLNQKDKYQLNSMAEFLFNKYGFHAFKNDKTPNAKRCDGLYADLVKVTAMLKTKFVIVLKDCNGFEVYRTGEGVSKFKEFKRAYQDAMRKAFMSFEGMNVRQKEIEYFTDEKPVEETPIVNKGDIPQVEEQPFPVDEIDLKTTVSKREDVSVLPKDKFSNYTHKGNTFLLRKTDEGYFLYQEVISADGGLLLKGRVEAMTESKIYFTDQSNKLFKASFDASENLTIEKGETVEVYKRVR